MGMSRGITSRIFCTIIVFESKISCGVRGSLRSISCLRALVRGARRERKVAPLVHLALSPVQITKSISFAHSCLIQSNVMLTNDMGESQSLPRQLDSSTCVN